MLSKKIKSELMTQFGKSSNDTGSSEVQVAFLSVRIQQVSEHLKTFPKDKHSQRGLVMLVGQRKAHLNYLKKNNEQSYNKIVQQLKINN